MEYSYESIDGTILVNVEIHLTLCKPGCVAQSVVHLTQEQDPVRPHTFVSPSADSRRAVVSYWRKYVHKVLVTR